MSFVLYIRVLQNFKNCSLKFSKKILAVSIYQYEHIKKSDLKTQNSGLASQFSVSAIFLIIRRNDNFTKNNIFIYGEKIAVESIFNIG